jgi:hypothetical protein
MSVLDNPAMIVDNAEEVMCDDLNSPQTGKK